MGIFLRKLWRNKPKQWGPWKAVHRSLMENAAKMGIDLASITLAMPMWKKASNIIHDYASNLHGTITGADWVNGGLDFNQTGDYVNCGNAGKFLTDKGTIFFEYQQTNTPASFYYWAVLDDDFNEFSIVGTIDENNIQLIINGESRTFAGSPTGLYDGKEHSLVFTWDASVNIRKYYIDGKLVSTLSNAFTWDAAGVDDHDFLIGGRLTGTDRHAGGIISNFTVHNKILNLTQIAQLSENPWQIWQPRPEIFYSVPTDPGSTILPISLILNNLSSAQGDQI